MGGDVTTGHVNEVGKVLQRAHDGDACRFFHAASTSASRSGVMPAFMCAWRSCGRDLNHASVSRAVLSSERKVSPLESARLMLVRVTPSSAPAHTGISDQACTF